MSLGLHALSTMWQVSGPRGLARAIKPRLASTRRVCRFEIDLERWEPPCTTPASVQVVHGLEALERLRRCRPWLPAQFYLDRLREARRPYLGLCDGEVGHISWLFTPRERSRLIVLRPEEVELDGAFTLPGARGRGLLTMVECAMLLDARREGYARAYTHVAVDNVASLRGVKKTGFSEVGVVTLRWTLGRQRVSYRELEAPGRSDPEPTVPAT